MYHVLTVDEVACVLHQPQLPPSLTTHLIPTYLHSMHHVLSVNKMTSVLHQAQQLAHIAAPVTEHCLWCYGGAEVDYPLGAVDLQVQVTCMCVCSVRLCVFV